MPDYMEGLFHAHEVIYKEAVLRDTWGHLAPEAGGKVYFGTIVYTHTEWGHYELISMDFGSLGSSPWLYDAMNDFIFKLSTGCRGI